ncbi:carbamoyl phosphate synthase small subunit [Fructilactobacillus vespulae]|uniref:carbamoyl phosphate synthase small subunit n=1 Tax=Fructilactobacillus vespulae TaxID=1249630 RepID=UPI0039B5DCDE
MKKRYLLLEDGSIYTGESFGSEKDSIGELVFSTGMSGYQQSISDQSYNGEILMFTYPLIGNYGVNGEDLESANPTCKGVVVSEIARKTDNWRMNMTLSDYLVKNDIPGISGLDTRAITKHIRECGAMKAAILNEITADSLEELKTTELSHNRIPESATKQTMKLTKNGRRIVVIDFGLKNSILRELGKRNCDVVVLPPNTTFSEIDEYHPDGVMLTNGPGDPMDVAPETLEMVREVENKYPLFGICMGNQLFALANGATTSKMKFGHRGFNHPVRNLANGRIDFTSQNHGYTVNRESVKGTPLKVILEEINDGTVEGLQHTELPAFSAQFHPDAAPGPHDTDYLFDTFMQMIDDNELDWNKEDKEHA